MSMPVQPSLATVLLFFAAVLPSPAQSNQAAIAPSHRIELFDGRSLAGWTFVSKEAGGNAGGIWSVTNGIIHCVGMPNGYARTLQAYMDYHLHVEWRWPDGPGNSGVFLHLNGDDKVWPLCLEAQLQSGNAGEIRLNGGAGLIGKPTTLKSVPRRAEPSEEPLGKWNTCDIVCRSNTASVRVNGVLQNEVSGTSVSSGTIALQAEGKPVEFRNLWLDPVANPVSSPAASTEPPTSWIDPDTGHRVIRLTREPGSDSFYFNYNAYTPDGKKMAYTTPNGISVLDLKTLQAKRLVTGRTRTIIVGHKTPTLYYTRPTDDRFFRTLWRVNLDTGENRKIADLPRRANVTAINADETLGAGTFIEGDANAGGSYDGTLPHGQITETNLGEPLNKGEMMTRRLEARLPMTMFTIDLRTGKTKTLLQHNTNWLNHLQFSPTDPTLLLYCHEGHWQLVNRIWTIRTDGTHNQLIHRRIMEMEMAGHEWWGADGETVFYQLHFPRGGRVSFIASYNVKTQQRVWLQYNARDQSSIHDNSSPDGRLFCGDGDPSNPWIILLRPVMIRDRNTLGEHLIKGGYLVSERLVNMSRHNYRLEPNPSFTPDMKYIVFRSNMFGPDYAFAVEVAKADASR